MVLATPLYEADGLLFSSVNGNMKSILVPINPMLRTTLNVVENFVAHNVALPADAVNQSHTGSLYKPLWSSEWMRITVSNWCSYYRLNYDTAMYESVQPDSVFGKGFYQIIFEVPYIYIGPHKEGQSFSLTLRVVQVLFQPHKLHIPITPTQKPFANNNNNNIQVSTTSSLNSESLNGHTSIAPTLTTNSYNPQVSVAPNLVSEILKKQVPIAPAQLPSAQSSPKADGDPKVALRQIVTRNSDCAGGEGKRTNGGIDGATEGKRKRARKNGSTAIPLSEFK